MNIQPITEKTPCFGIMRPQHARLIRFVYDRDQAYMLEFGNLYMRVFKDGAWNGTEIVTPYTSAMLPELNYMQNTDTMFLAHPQVPVQRLQRFGDTSWSMLAAPFTVAIQIHS
jgi:hypothetical protein